MAHTLPRFRWKTETADAAVVDALAARFGLPRPVAGVLGARLAGEAEAERFLDPRLLHLGDPLVFPGIADASERIWTAIRNRDDMVVFGDFDADGVTATALLSGVLTALGGRVAVFLPDRVQEGYGLTRAALERCLREHPVRLLLTVDCGISSCDEVALAQARGVDVIVTDHHEPGDRLPEARVVVNPRLGSSPGAEHLCGAGVAFKLAHALVKMGRAAGDAASAAYDVRQWLDAVAVATVADVVPLIGENRILVTAGLASLARSPRLGLQALKSRAGLTGELTSHHLAFVLGPRINAAGRMRTAWPALRLLAATDRDAAQALAVELEQLNAERRGVEANLVAEAEAQLRLAAPVGAAVAAGPGWHVGAIGIVAARLADAWGLPAAVVSLAPDGTGRGSVRGGCGDNVVAALAACADLLVRYGGHPRAAGFQVRAGALDAFRARFCAACMKLRQGGDPRPELVVDAWLTAAEIGPGLWQALQRLEPFGEGHARPRWGLRNLVLSSRPTPVGGGGEHLRLSFSAGGSPIAGVWFKMGRLSEAVARSGPRFDAAFELHENTFGGRTSLEMQVVDLRPAGIHGSLCSGKREEA